MAPTSLEICAGAGGQALGLEQAGFQHRGLVEIDADACRTLRLNRPNWPVLRADARGFSALKLRGGIDLLAAGVPCPPFSVAGKQLGASDERDLFPEMIRIATECDPRAIFIENVSGLLENRFDAYRSEILFELESLGYEGEWRRLQASDFGVPQLRPRALLIAMRTPEWKRFEWPQPVVGPGVTVGKALRKEMASRGWAQATSWAQGANTIAPTLVGGSKKHGGPDLGPSRARAAWAKLGVNGKLVAAEAPGPDFEGMPCLTVRMAAIVQGFPPDWEFYGRKTTAYRQVGNAFPPPVARAVGLQIRRALEERNNDEEAA